MGTEMVACPCCGKQTWATIPEGQRVVRVVRDHYDLNAYEASTLKYQECTSQTCKKSFGVLTEWVRH